MPTRKNLSVFDFRKGLDEYSTIENSPMDVATVAQNVRILPKGWLCKRPGLTWSQVGLSTRLYGIYLAEQEQKLELVGNYHFDNLLEGSVTSVADNGSGIARCTCTAHGLTTGDYISMNWAAVYSDQSDTVTVIDDNTFDVDNLSYSSTDTCDWLRIYGWSMDSTALVERTSGDHEIVITPQTTGASYEGIYINIPQNISIQAPTVITVGSTNAVRGMTIRVQASYTLTLNKKAIFRIKDDGGNVQGNLSDYEVTGTGSAATYDKTYQINRNSGPGTDETGYFTLEVMIKQDGGTFTVHSVSVKQEIEDSGTEYKSDLFYTTFGSAANSDLKYTSMRNVNIDDSTSAGIILVDHGGSRNFTQFSGRTILFAQGEDEYTDGFRTKPYSITSGYAIPWDVPNSSYVNFPTDWTITDNRIPNLPLYSTSLTMGASEILVAANNVIYPNGIWWTDIGTEFFWTGFSQITEFDISGLAAIRDALFVFTEKTTYIMQIVDGEAPVVLDKLQAGTRYHQSIITTGNNIYFMNTDGIHRISPLDGTDARFKIENMSINRISSTIDNIDFTQEVVGGFVNKHNKILWCVYLNADSKYQMIDFDISTNTYCITKFPITVRPQMMTKAFRSNSMWLAHNGITNSDTKNLMQINYSLDASRQNDISTANVSTAMNWQYQTPILHMGNLETRKKWCELVLYYNCRSGQSSYPFTVQIDKNPLDNDDDINNKHRYIRITSKIEVGDGASTWSDIDTTSGFSLGDMGTSDDLSGSISRKVFKFHYIGTSKAIQIKFSDNRIGTDFVIFGYTLKYEE